MARERCKLEWGFSFSGFASDGHLYDSGERVVGVRGDV